MNLVSRLLGVAVAVMGMLSLPGCDPQNIKELEEGLSTEADVRALLKPDQQKKFDEIQKQRAERKAEWQQFQAWKAQQPQKAQ